MNPPMPRVLALAALLLLPARAPSADVLLLKDGKRVEGEVSEQGDTYEVRTPYGSLNVRKEDVAKRLKSATALTAEIEALRKSAAEMADEGLKIAGDAAARNQKLEAAAALYEKAIALCGDGRQAFPDAGLDRVSAALSEEFQKVRAGITPDTLAPAAPPKPPVAPPSAPPKEPPATPTAAPDSRKDPIPDAAEQKRAEKAIRDLYRADYQAKDPAARSALAEKFLKEAAGTQGEAAGVFVLYREARDAATEAGNVDVALEAIARMAGRFDVKADEMKAAALAAIRRKAAAPEDLVPVAGAFLALAEDQVRKGDFDGALRNAREAESTARSARDAAAALRASTLVRDIPEMKRAHDPFAKAEQTLAASPADPEANLAAGRYLCFVRNDWDTGLPLLAKGSQPALAQAAAKELDKPEDAAGQAKLADLWWDLAEKERNAFDKRGCQDRARSWYERAAPGATGLVLVRIEKRLADLEKAASGAGASGPVDLLRLIDPAKDAVQGSWSFSGKVLVTPAGGRLQIPYVPPAEYDLTIVAEKKDVALFFVGLVAAGTPFSVLLDHNGSTASCIGLFGLGVAGEPSTFFAGEAFSKTAPSTAVCSVRRTGVVVTVDKRKIVEYRGDCRKLPMDPDWKVPDVKALAIGSNSPYHVSKIVLTPVSGQGRRLRS